MRVLTFDAETFYDADYSLKKMSTSEYVHHPRFRLKGFAIKDGETPAYWVPEERAAWFLRAAKKQFEQSAVLCHHTHFDALILETYGIRPKLWLDTLSMARGLGLGLTVGGSLAALKKHFGLGDKKPIAPDSTPEQLAARGTDDANDTYAIFKHLVRGYPPAELQLIDMTIRWFTEPRILGNIVLLEQLIETLQNKKWSMLNRLSVTEEDLQSADRFIALLEGLGVEVEYKLGKPNKDGSPKLIPAIAKTDKFMQDLTEHEDDNVATLAGARLGIKSTGDLSRAQRFRRMADHGALPVYLAYYAAHPGRWGGGDGTNMQNLRRGGVLRDALEAPPGHHFVVGDLSQIECRIEAKHAGQDDLVEAFAQGADVYADFAGYAFRKPINKKDNPAERFCGKFTVLGCGYGMGAKKYVHQYRAELFKQGLDYAPLDESAAKTIIDLYRQRYYRIPAYWRQAEGLLDGRYPSLGPVARCAEGLLLPNGMKLRYPELQKTDGGWTYRGKRGITKLWGGSIVENMTQALARIIMADMMLELKRQGFHIAMTVHDEIVMIVPDAEVASAKATMQEVMTGHVPEWARDIPIACEIGSGRTYGACK